MSTGGSTRAVIAALLANLGIAIAKFAGFLFTGSSSMLAESIHSVADTGNQITLVANADADINAAIAGLQSLLSTAATVPAVPAA